MSAVKVAVRVRPFTEREISRDAKCVISMKDRQTSLLASRAAGEPKRFTFDYSYWSFHATDAHYVSQEKVHSDLGQLVLEAAFTGYNASIFAYGQTGSGKTYSMMGWDGQTGLVPRISQELFNKAEGGDQNSFSVEVSYLEIYNEKVRDLMIDGGVKHNLKVREHPQTGSFVDGLSKHTVVSSTDLLRLIELGNNHRTTAATQMNDVSSRSHAIFTINFTQARIEDGIPSETMSRMNLVDLAGSERVESSGATGDRLREGSNINKSLTTLGLVISTLAANSITASKANTEKKKFVPYRDSVLTWLLKDSLGGNSKTIMLAAISPADINYGETLSTLRYANRAKSIVNKAVVNEDPNVLLIRQLREEITKLRALIGNQEQTTTPNRSLQTRLSESTALMETLTHEWQDKWSQSQKILQEGSLALSDSGARVRVESERPHLVELSASQLTTSITICNIRDGLTTFGLSTSSPDIELMGDDILELHCTLESDGEVVVLVPQSGASCFIDSVRVVENTQLSQGNIVALGQQNVFRFHHPAEAERLRHTAPNEMRTHRIFTPDRASMGPSNEEMLKEERKRLEEKLQLERTRVQEELHQLNSTLQVEKEAVEEQKVKYSSLMQEEERRLWELKEQVTEKESVLREHQEKIREHEQNLQDLLTASPQLTTKKQHPETQPTDPGPVQQRQTQPTDPGPVQQRQSTPQPKDLEEQKQLSLERKEVADLREQLQRRRFSSPTRQPSMLFRSNMKDYLSTRHNLSHIPQLEVSDEGVCRGFLIKQGELVKSWKKRFFVFNPSFRTFTYYSDHTQKHVKGIIYFDAIQSVWCDANGATDWMHKFYVETLQRTYNIRAQTQAVMRAWLDILLTTQLENAEMS